jgi:hypothetical protein
LELRSRKQEVLVAQDAIALLKADHRKVEDLFEQYQEASGAKQKAKLAHEICTELKIHTTIEEEIFYPALRGKIERSTLDEAYVEHDGAKALVNELEEGSPADEFYDAKVTVLSEDIKHHVREEERWVSGMFAQAKKAGVDLDALGEKLAARKAKLMAEAEKEGLPPAEPRTMHAQAA